jgi:hypothetical protein
VQIRCQFAAMTGRTMPEDLAAGLTALPATA